MNSKQRRVTRRRIEVYAQSFAMARTRCEAAARGIREFGLSMRQVNQSLLRAVGGKNAG